MSPSIDDKKYATDTRKFSEAIVQEGVLADFEDSPVSEVCEVKDICVYKPGDLNKNNKEGKTSWDSFSYFLLMAHNVYQHIESVQRANALADIACTRYKPSHLEWSKVKAKQEEFDLWVPRDVIYVTEFINKLFKSETPMQLLEEGEAMLTNFSGMKSIKTSQSAFDSLFDSGDAVQDESDGEFTAEQSEEAEDFLEHLEQ